MEKSIKVKPEYSSLDIIQEHLKSNSPYDISKEYDHWEIRTDTNGQMEQCLVLKKGKMHGAKAYLKDGNTLKIDYIIPNKLMHAYFGKSEKAYKNILEIIMGKIKNIALAESQKKAFDEILKSLDSMQANS